MTNYSELRNQSTNYLDEMAHERAYKKRHKKHHRRSHDGPSSEEILANVDIYEAKEKDQASAEKATMDMI
jgi:hypothetical protein